MLRIGSRKRIPLVLDMAWWAVPESIVGVGVSIITGHASEYHVVQSATKPSGSADSPVYGPFATQAEAQAQASELNGIAQSGAKAGEKAAGIASPLSGIDAIGAFFNIIGNRETWVRVIEVGLGTVLVFIGINHLTGGAATKAIKAVPK